jgi:hypothetical protein
MADPAKARELLDKLRAFSQKARKRFDDLPDMRTDGSIEKVKIDQLATDALGMMEKDAEEAGFKLEAKVVGVALRVVMLDPQDPTRTKMVTTEIALTHPKLNLRDLLSDTESAPEIDMSRLMNEDGDNTPYEAKSKPDGFMYG